MGCMVQKEKVLPKHARDARLLRRAEARRAKEKNCLTLVVR